MEYGAWGRRGWWLTKVGEDGQSLRTARVPTRRPNSVRKAGQEDRNLISVDKEGGSYVQNQRLCDWGGTQERGVISVCANTGG